MRVKDFTIGCDPEIFVKKGGLPVSADSLIPGDKKAPFPVNGGAIQVDGTAVEFNTEPVSIERFEDWNAKVVLVMKELQKAVQKNGNDYNFNISPIQEYTQEYFDSLPESAKELGCDPDFCAYTLQPNPRPDGDRLFRTGAGHLHFGWGADIPTDNREHHEICAGFVKMLDATVGIFMTCIDRDPRRRELYGKAGAYRAKPYGVEYRFPSNVWLSSMAYRKMVWLLSKKAIEYMLGEFSVRGLTGYGEEEIRRILNDGDVKRAERLIEKGYYGSIAQDFLYSEEYQRIGKEVK